VAKNYETKLSAPWLKRVWIKDELVLERNEYPFHIPLFRSSGFELSFDNPVTIIVGDNGSGKSTLLEAISELAGFGKLGGSRDHQTFNSNPWDEGDGSTLSRYMGASWLPKMTSGWFFRAESFYSLSQFFEQSAYDVNQVGPGYLSHSHGEGFMRFFKERGNTKGLFLFDEPESALSPLRQFEFIKLIVDQVRKEKIQTIIATHSPILMAIPGAQLLQIDKSGMYEVDYRDTAYFRLYREFFSDPLGTIESLIQES
jgi:predicted ATPase